MLREANVSTEELTSRPEAAAYSLVQKIYAWFGISSEKIPYVSADGEKRFVDPRKIIHSKP